MRILVVSQFYTPDITAAAFRISETVGYLKEFGNEVEVVTSFPHKRENSYEVIESQNVHRVHLPKTEGESFWGYMYQYLSFLVKGIVRGYKVGHVQKPQIVWASSPPIFAGLGGWILARLLGAKFALDIRDVWPDSAVAAGQISNSGFIYKMGCRLEIFLYNRADVVSCVAHQMKRYIQEHTDSVVKVIYNGVEVSVADQNQNGESDKLNKYKTSEGANTLLYAGNFGHVQQLDILVNVIGEMDQNSLKNDWEVFFLGGGAKESYLKELVERKDLGNVVHFLNPVPKEEVFCYLRSAHALFIHLQESEVLRLTIPSKVFDYLYVDRPLLAGIQGEGKEIIDSVEGNVTFRSGDKQSLIEALKVLDDQIVHISNMNNASKVCRRYSRKSQSEKLNEIFEEILFL